MRLSVSVSVCLSRSVCLRLSVSVCRCLGRAGHGRTHPRCQLQSPRGAHTSAMSTTRNIPRPAYPASRLFSPKPYPALSILTLHGTFGAGGFVYFSAFCSEFVFSLLLLLHACFYRFCCLSRMPARAVYCFCCCFLLLCLSAFAPFGAYSGSLLLLVFAFLPHLPGDGC